MSGHSHAANVAHKKAKVAAVKGKIYTKIGREIAVAVKAGGSDPSTNARLYDAIAKAKMNNMPNDNITRCIKKAAGELGDVTYEAVTYEGYAAGGVAVIVEGLTDNKNRTVGDVRHLFDKNGGSMGASGCVGYMFERKGVFVGERGGKSEDALINLALEAGADDVAVYEDDFEIFSSPQNFAAVLQYFEKAKLPLISAEISMLPVSATSVDEATRLKVESLVEKLDELDDVQNVYTNLDG